MITLESLTKQYGDKKVVDGLTVAIPPGKVTGFLGPNGAGKTTTMRMVLGLARPTSGTALVNGRPYAGLEMPLHTVGALLDPRAGLPGQSARSHLLGMARSNGIPARRVAQTLETVGLSSVAGKRLGTFSLGMRQRLGIAAALLGEPDVLIFDEPVNGLDPEGVAWIRGLMRSQAEAGRTVFVSSHLMSEMQATADHLVVIGRGRLLANDSVEHVIAASTRNAVKVSSPDAGRLRGALEVAGFSVEMFDGGDLRISGASLETVGAIAFAQHVQLNELSRQSATLEQAFTEMTAGDVEYGAGAGSRPDSDTDSNAKEARS